MSHPPRSRRFIWKRPGGGDTVSHAPPDAMNDGTPTGWDDPRIGVFVFTAKKTLHPTTHVVGNGAPCVSACLPGRADPVLYSASLLGTVGPINGSSAEISVGRVVDRGHHGGDYLVVIHRHAAVGPPRQAAVVRSAPWRIRRTFVHAANAMERAAGRSCTLVQASACCQVVCDGARVPSVRDLLRRIAWPVVAVAGWCIAVVLGVVAGVQAAELQNHHLYIDWGNFPEWLQGVGTFAAFGALYFAANEWRAQRIERRDAEADQARLILVEPAIASDPAPPRMEDICKTPWPQVVVRNHSDGPIFNLVVRRVYFRRRDGELIGNGQNDFYALSGGESTPRIVPQVHRHDVADILKVHFTDARGRRWERRGRGQPTRVTSSADVGVG